MVASLAHLAVVEPYGPDDPMVPGLTATTRLTAAAHRLGPSHSTVKHHLANARSKVGATTTAQLVWLAARLPKPEARADEHRSTTS